MAEYLDRAGLVELWARVKAEDSKGVKIATGSYVGTGTHGSDNPCTLTFDFTPKFVMVYQQSSMGNLTGYYYEWYTEADSDNSYIYPSNTLIAAYGANSAERCGKQHSSYGSDGRITDHFTWGENSFSWYSTGSASASYKNGIMQLNHINYVYNYIAIG